MSRHRNVRNMIAEEDFYDDYGDYDDYDGMPMQATAPKKKKKKKKNKDAAATPAAADSNNNNNTSTTTPPKAAPASAGLRKPSSGVVSGASSSLTVLPASSKNTSSGDKASATAIENTKTSAAVPVPPVPPVLLERRAKPSLTVVICGHVDAGKSTLTGQLLWASGNTASSNNTTSRRPPQNFAWLLDEDEEERKHGVTMEVATKVVTTEKYEIILQDAPGHSDYVPSMITGTASADAAVVVVDATDFGTSFGAGQLREHLFLAKGLGIQQLIVAINKMDLLAWSEDAYVDMQSQLQTFLQGLGYNTTDKVHFCPLSGLTGVNVIKAPTEPELVAWYKGPTFWQTLDCLDAPNVGSKLLEKPLRMIITDVTGEAGKGVAVRAKVATGWVSQGDPLVLLPVQDETTLQKITRLEQFAGNANAERDKYAVAGELLDLVLPGLDISRVSTGNVLGRPGRMPSLSTRCRAKIVVLEGLTIPIIRGAQAILHMHYLDVPCHLSGLLQTLKPNGSVLKERPRVLTAKTQAIVEITLHYPIAMEAFANCRTLGRFVLRRNGATIAVGRVEEAF